MGLFIISGIAGWFLRGCYRHFASDNDSRNKAIMEGILGFLLLVLSIMLLYALLPGTPAGYGWRSHATSIVSYHSAFLLFGLAWGYFSRSWASQDPKTRSWKDGSFVGAVVMLAAGLLITGIVKGVKTEWVELELGEKTEFDLTLDSGQLRVFYDVNVPWKRDTALKEIQSRIKSSFDYDALYLLLVEPGEESKSLIDNYRASRLYTENLILPLVNKARKLSDNDRGVHLRYVEDALRPTAYAFEHLLRSAPDESVVSQLALIHAVRDSLEELRLYDTQSNEEGGDLWVLLTRNDLEKISYTPLVYVIAARLLIFTRDERRALELLKDIQACMLYNETTSDLNCNCCGDVGSRIKENFENDGNFNAVLAELEYMIEYPRDRIMEGILDRYDGILELITEKQNRTIEALMDHLGNSSVKDKNQNKKRLSSRKLDTLHSELYTARYEEGEQKEKALEKLSSELGARTLGCEKLLKVDEQFQKGVQQRSALTCLLNRSKKGLEVFRNQFAIRAAESGSYEHQANKHAEMNFRANDQDPNYVDTFGFVKMAYAGRKLPVDIDEVIEAKRIFEDAYKLIEKKSSDNIACGSGRGRANPSCKVKQPRDKDDDRVRASIIQHLTLCDQLLLQIQAASVND